MPQNVDIVKDHVSLFQEPEYKEMLARKRDTFEAKKSAEKVDEVEAWTKSWDYREKNFARENLVINPAKACQPLGASFAAAGFEGTLAFIHGSQGCSAYFRSHLSRHFKEPNPGVCSSMTEDAAVFGGLNNMIDGLANAYTLYKPKMIAVATSCIAEVIGDDLQAFIINAKKAGSVPEDFDVPFAHTPSFVGSHVQGYDNMMRGVLTHFWDNAERVPNERINIIPGFDGYCVGNIRELKRMLDVMGVDYTILCDPSENFDSAVTGEYKYYNGGTSLEAVRDAINSKATISLMRECTVKTLEYCKEKGQDVYAFNYPLGIKATDDLLMKISELTGKPIPAELAEDRGRMVDALTDSMQWIHGRRFAVYGDPDFVIGMCRFLLELGAEPIHVMATNGSKSWAKKLTAELKESPYGANATVWPAKDLWHMRSLLCTEPVDFVIGNSHGKYLEKDTGVSLMRLTFPIFDRHHHHRFPQIGYRGALQVLVRMLDKALDVIDAKSMESGISYDLTR